MNSLNAFSAVLFLAFTTSHSALAGADDLVPDSAATTVEASPAYAAGYILVKPKAGVSDETYRAILASSGAEPWLKQREDLYRKARVPEGQEQAIADQLSTNPLIEWAQPDHYQRSQSMPSEFQGLTWRDDPLNPGLTPATDKECRFSTMYCDHAYLRSFDAWDITRGAGQVIAFIDSGIDPNDPDLAGQIAPGGWNFVFNDGDTGSADHRVCLSTDVKGNPVGGTKTSCYHGTGVGLTAVGLADNAEPKVGVAPEAKAVPFVAVKDSDIAAGISRAADSGIKIVNTGIGGPQWMTPVLVSAGSYLKSKGGLVISSAGNSADATRQTEAAEAAYLIVAATKSGGLSGLADYSNRGPSIDFCAPEFIDNGGGTSNAAPAVSAAAALVWAVNPNFTNVEVEQILKDAAAARPGNSSPDCKGKLLDVGGAVKLAAQRASSEGAADTQPPRVSFEPLPFVRQDTGIWIRARSLTVDQVATVDVDAGDDRGVAKVALMAGSQVIGEDLTAPYQFVLDAKALAKLGLVNGTLTAQAVDLTGKTAITAAGLGFTVKAQPEVQAPADTMPPTVSLTKLNSKVSLRGKTLAASKVFSAQVAGSDDRALDSLRVYVDGMEIGTITTKMSDGQRQTARYSLDTRRLTNGLHLLKVVAMDGAGNVAEAAMKLKVKNPPKAGKKV